MPNADSSEMTRLKRLRAQANDSNGNVALSKFRGTNPIGILPSLIKYSLSKFLPGTGVHSIAAAQQASADRPKGNSSTLTSPLFNNSNNNTTTPLSVYWNAASDTFATSGTCNAIAYANGLWVAVGSADSSGNRVYTSTHPVSTWTASPGPLSTSQGQLFQIYYGGGFWVACGNDGYGNTIFYTTNPITGPWTGIQLFDIGRDIVYTGTHWIAAGRGANALYWATSITGPWTAVPSVFPTGNTAYSVSHADGKVVATGTNGFVHWVDEGAVEGLWNNINDNLLGGDCFEAKYAQGYWAITTSSTAGTGGGVYVTFLTSGGHFVNIFSAGLGNQANSITYGNNFWVITGINQQTGGENTWYSDNASTGPWYPVATPLGNQGDHGKTVVYANGYFVLGGRNTVQTSKNIWYAQIPNQ